MATAEVIKMWTGKRKAEAVLDMLKGKVTLIDFCRKHDLKQSDVQSWIDDFVSSGTKGVTKFGKKKKDAVQHENEMLKKAVGEIALENMILKKSIELTEQEENES